MSLHTGRELRAAYVEYFRSQKSFPHPVVASAPLIPPDDPTLLFTSAGMVQFKSLYSGAVDPLPYPRAATVQKCLRAGGKGSDLENVGKTLRHHTFFEMLGNFSFGDYFKREAIHFAWEFLTSPQWMGLPRERLFATIYGPTTAEIDREAEAVWRDTDLVNAIVPLDARENFWGPAGEGGACGPCSEIKFFMGGEAELRKAQELGRSGDEGMRELARRIVDEGDTFLEVWNLVFPQFDQQRDGTRLPLKNRGIDTGAGLERMTTAMLVSQGSTIVSQYETDLLWPIVRAVSETLKVDYRKFLAAARRDRIAHPDEPHADITADGGASHRDVMAVNAIADHVRALTFCISEGITPSNVGRGYVVRRIQRRALRFASLLGRDEPFMAGIYDAVVEAVGDAYPEIKANPDFIRKALRIEEETFLRTRNRGEKLLDEMIAQARDGGSRRIAGEDAFRLWDTYGYPIDLTREVAADAGVEVDEAGYNAAREESRREAKKSWKGSSVGVAADALDAVHEEHGATPFTGYAYVPEPSEARVLAILKDGKTSVGAGEGDEVLLVLERSPFYAESGGQVGDTGQVLCGHGRGIVLDTQKTPNGVIVHRVKVEHGGIRVGEVVEAAVDAARRQSIVRHHSSVHLLQNALKRVVGQHITQAGSYVGPQYARFDFTHTEAIPAEVLREVQAAANDLILGDHETVTEVLAIDEARRKGAIAPFGEKYGATVRVVTMGPSVEFCGGVHCEHTSQAGQLRITGESSIASGVRRIELVVGAPAVEATLAEQYAVIGPLQAALAVKGPELVARVQSLSSRLRELERDNAGLRRDLALARLGDPTARAEELPEGARMLAVRLDGCDGAELRAVAEQLRDRIGDAALVVVVGAAAPDKVGIVVASAKAVAGRHNAGKIANAIAQQLGGKGGGKPEMAQAGAKDTARIDEVLAGIRAIVMGSW